MTATIMMIMMECEYQALKSFWLTAMHGRLKNQVRTIFFLEYDSIKSSFLYLSEQMDMTKEILIENRTHIYIQRRLG